MVVKACTPGASGVTGSSRGPYASFNLANHVQDDPAAVAANRSRLLHELGCRRIQWLTQEHGVEVLAADLASAELEPTADAAWTAAPGLALAVLSADCLPVVVAARDGSVVGIAHAGWRGLVAGVVPRLLESMASASGEFVAWLGPGISAAAYEVGEDVATAARAAGARLTSGRAPGKYQLDLAATAAEQLEAAGAARVEVCATCAAESAATFSHRRDGLTGRMATVVWIDSPS